MARVLNGENLDERVLLLDGFVNRIRDEECHRRRQPQQRECLLTIKNYLFYVFVAIF